MSDAIFSFGTLQLDTVQQDLFGRIIPTVPDELAGWVVGELTIVDPAVIAASGTDRHPALHATGNPTDIVEGAILQVTAAELARADEYEQASYRRISVTLRSGKQAWIYIPLDADG